MFQSQLIYAVWAAWLCILNKYIYITVSVCMYMNIPKYICIYYICALYTTLSLTYRKMHTVNRSDVYRHNGNIFQWNDAKGPRERGHRVKREATQNGFLRGSNGQQKCVVENCSTSATKTARIRLYVEQSEMASCGNAAARLYTHTHTHSDRLKNTHT